MARDGDRRANPLPPVDHPADRSFRLLRMRSIGPDYTAQKELLEELHRQKDTDIFVASFSAVKKPGTGEVRTYRVWSDGVVALLPRADDIVFLPRATRTGRS